MLRQPRWNQLAAGVAAVFAVIGVALAVLVFGRVGALHGKRFTLYVTTGTARGVASGTQVWLSGQRVGDVRTVVFRPPSVPADERLVMVLDVLESARSHIRKNSTVDIRSGLSVIGDQVVFLSGGTMSAPEIPRGDTLHEAQQSDIEAAAASASQATKEFPAIIDNVKLLTAQLRSASGTLGAIGVQGVSADLAQFHASADRARRLATSGNGSVARFMADTGLLHRHVQLAMAEIDSIRTLVSSDQHSLGRFRRDSTLKREIVSLRAQAARLDSAIKSPHGTVGRIEADSALTNGLHRERAAMDSLFADMKKHPTKYVSFP